MGAKNADVVHIKEGAKVARSALYKSMVRTRSGKDVVVEKAIQEVKAKFDSIKDCMAAAIIKCQKYKKVAINPGKYTKTARDKRKSDRETIKLQKAQEKRSKQYNFLKSLKHERGTFSKVAKNPGLQGYYSKTSKSARKLKWEAGAPDRAAKKVAREQQKLHKEASKAELAAIRQSEKDYKEAMKAKGIKPPRKKKDSLQQALMAALED